MSRIFLFLAVLITCTTFLFACNNDSASSSANKDSANASTGFVWTKEDDNEFLQDCIEEAKVKYGEDTAYIKCNCVLKQLKMKFPNLDSASMALNDTARAAEYAKNCY